MDQNGIYVSEINFHTRIRLLDKWVGAISIENNSISFLAKLAHPLIAISYMISRGKLCKSFDQISRPDYREQTNAEAQEYC